MSHEDPTPKATGGRERRRHPRVRGDWPVTVELPDGPHQARVRDVSRGGVSFFLDRPIQEMTLLRVEFDLPAGAGIRRTQRLGRTRVPADW